MVTTENTQVTTTETEVIAEKRAKTAETIEKGISEKITLLDGAISSPEILEKVAKFNYTAERLTAAKALATETATLHAAQKKEQGEALTASQKFTELKELADEEYTDFVALARYIFKNNETARRALLLDGSRKKAFGSWSEEGKVFYTNALTNPEIAAEFAKNGITADMLKAGGTALLNAISYKVNAEKEKSEAIRATELRDTKLEELDEFVKGFRAFAKVALKGRADLVKKLGI